MSSSSSPSNSCSCSFLKEFLTSLLFLNGTLSALSFVWVWWHNFNTKTNWIWFGCFEYVAIGISLYISSPVYHQIHNELQIEREKIITENENQLSEFHKKVFDFSKKIKNSESIDKYITKYSIVSTEKDLKKLKEFKEEENNTAKYETIIKDLYERLVENTEGVDPTLKTKYETKIKELKRNYDVAKLVFGYRGETIVECEKNIKDCKAEYEAEKAKYEETIIKNFKNEIEISITNPGVTIQLLVDLYIQCIRIYQILREKHPALATLSSTLVKKKLWLCSKGPGTVFCGTIRKKTSDWYVCRCLCLCLSYSEAAKRQNHVWIDIPDLDATIPEETELDVSITANYCPMGCGHDPCESYWDYQRFLPANYVFKKPSFKDKIFDCDKVANLLVAFGWSDQYKLALGSHFLLVLFYPLLVICYLCSCWKYKQLQNQIKCFWGKRLHIDSSVEALNHYIIP